MNSIGGSFSTPYFIPGDEQVQQVAQAVENLTLQTPQERAPPKGLLSVAETDGGILAFCQSLAERRTSKKCQVAKYFTDSDHVVSLCGDASPENCAFVQETVQNPHFLGRLWRQDVEFILSGQKPNAGILYIDEEWVPTELNNSCSPKQLFAKLLFSFVGAGGDVVDFVLTPEVRVERVCKEQNAYFLEVDPSNTANKYFAGFAASNLLRLQALSMPAKIICQNPADIHTAAQCIFDMCAAITREELDLVLQEDMRVYRPTDRYNNIVPYTINCVGTGITGQDINGSYIRSGNRLFIACQGPRDNTIDAFWQAVIHHGTKTVIALGPALERTTEKFSDKYFMFDKSIVLSDLTCVQKCGVDTALDWQFTVKRKGKADMVINHCLISRTFELISPTGEKSTVQHLHCPTWQDMRGGDPRVLVELIKSIEATPCIDVPIVVHCSAGVGRTGTLIAAYEMHHQLANDPEKPLALASTIIEHRHQRYGVVQSNEQIEMLLAYIALAALKM